MAFAFPVSPSAGQIVEGPGGIRYSWDATAGVSRWVAEPMEVGGPFARSSAWAAGTNPNNTTLFYNNFGRDLTIISLTAVIEVAESPNVSTVQVVKAASSERLNEGVSVGSFNANSAAGTYSLTVAPLQTVLPAGARLGIQTLGFFTTSVASVTVGLN